MQNFLFQKLTEEKYDIKMEPEESAIKISTTTEPKVVVTVTLTSPIMRDTVEPTPGNVEYCKLKYLRVFLAIILCRNLH